jgi:hypothetical protein
MMPVKAISHQLDSHIGACSESILPNLGRTKFDELENVGFILKKIATRKSRGVKFIIFLQIFV